VLHMTSCVEHYCGDYRCQEAIENLEGAHQCSYMPASQGSNEKKYYLLRSHLNSEILIIKANVARAGTSINGRGNIMFLCS
jgi:hypothetical protein